MTTQYKVFKTLLRTHEYAHGPETSVYLPVNPDGPAAVEALGPVVESGNKLLEWWPEGSENSTAAEQYGEGFAADLTAFRTALGALNK